MHSIVVVRPVRQHTTYTCTVAALASLIGRDYDDVYDYTHRTIGERIKGGLWVKDIKAVARHYGVNLKTVRVFDPDADTGLLMVYQGRNKCEHTVLLFNGTLYDPMDGQLWEPDAYLASYDPKSKARFLSLLTVQEP